MYIPGLVGSLATLLCISTAVTAATADPVVRSTDVFAWPANAPSPLPFAKISYSWPTLNATVQSYTAPAVTTDETVRVGVHRAGDWVGVAAKGHSFNANRRPSLRLYVDDSGDVWHVGFTTAESVKPSGNTLAVDVVPLRQGPQVAFDKPVVVKPQGEADDTEPEKSFLQKYWWAIALFLLVQVVMGGGGDK